MEAVAALSRAHVGTAVLGALILVFGRNVLRGARTAGDEGPSDAVVAARKGVVFRTLVAVLTTIDDVLWLAGMRWVSYLLRGDKMRSLPVPGEEGVRRADPSKPLLTTCMGATTTFEIFENATARFANRPAFGTRTYIGETEPEGPKKLTKKIFGETTWRTYSEVRERVLAFGAALRKTGMEPYPGTAHEYEKAKLGTHCLMIYENSCDPWTTAALGAFTQSVIVATSYATLGFDAMLNAAEETGSHAMLCNRSVVKDVIAKGSSTVRVIIYTNNYVAPEEAAKPMPRSENGFTIYSVDEFIELGKENPCESTPPTPDSLAVIMYTSGSTGKPKGVMLTHKCVTSSAGGALEGLMKYGTFEFGKEVHLAYLPAAHIFELTVEMTVFAMGGSMGFADPRSISSNGAVRQRPDGTLNTEPKYPHPPGAIQEFRPTLMAGVPKVWDVLKAGALAKLGGMAPLAQAVIGEMVACRGAALKSGTDTPLFAFAFSKSLGKIVGGRLKAVVSGGGPLSAGTQSWVRAALCPIFVQGYGLTESNGATCLEDLDDCRDGIAGAPLTSVELKLHSVREVEDNVGKPYLATDTEHSVRRHDGVETIPCLGRGELWIRGGTVAQGYFKLPDKTKEAFVEGGWFRTGDICIWTSDGSIKIVDRLKNLVKLRGGEYVAVENMEKEYSQSVYVNQLNGGVLVVADGEMDRACLLAQANMVAIQQLADEKGIKGTPTELCVHPEIEKAVLEDLVAHAKKTLSPLEKIVAVRLLPGTGANNAPLSETAPWTPDNGGLLASNKLGRKSIEKELSGIIAKLRKKGIR